MVAPSTVSAYTESQLSCVFHNTNMLKRPTDTGSLRPQELEVIYAISKVVSESVKIEASWMEIIQLARQVFIFDNAAVYLQNEQDGQLEPTFARAIGRGRSSEADMAWGYMAAVQAFKKGRNYIRQSEINPNEDRMEQRFYLGLPLLVGGHIIGALIFIRFGGPVYTDDQINLAEFIATHVSQLLEHERLVARIANLEAERRLTQMQEDFIATVSHELNTPLGFIKGYTTTLLRQDTEWDETTRRDFLQIIDEETDRLSDLIDELLDSSRLQSGTLKMEMQQVDINGFIKELIERVRLHYELLQLQVQVEPSELYIQADPKRLHQVLENLLINSSKYAPNSTMVITVSSKDTHAQITLQDDGPGIPAKHLGKLFDRFYRVPERSAGVRGTGLGLFICDRIIRAHGGKIKVESEEGKGTTFQITLPVLSVEETPATLARGET